MDLVGPSTEIPEDACTLGHLKVMALAIFAIPCIKFAHIESLCDGESLAIVKRLNGSKDIQIPLHKLSDLDQVFSTLEAGHIKTPCGFECLMCGFHSSVHIGRHTLRNVDELLPSCGVHHTATFLAETSSDVKFDSLDGLCILVGGGGPFAVDEKPGWDLDLPLEARVVELVSEFGCHIVLCCRFV